MMSTPSMQERAEEGCCQRCGGQIGYVSDTERAVCGLCIALEDFDYDTQRHEMLFDRQEDHDGTHDD